MEAEIIPPGEEARRFRRDALRRRIAIGCAIVLGIAVAAGIVAVGFIVLAVAAVIGIAAGLVFAVLRWIGRQGVPGGSRGSDAARRVEIITARGETLDGGVVSDADATGGDDRRPFR